MGGLRKAAHYFLNSGMCYLNYSVFIFAWLTGLKFLQLVHLIWSPKRLCQKDIQSYISHYLIKLCIDFLKSLTILFYRIDSRKSYLTIMYVLDHYNSVKQICEFPRTVEWTLWFIIWLIFSRLFCLWDVSGLNKDSGYEAEEKWMVAWYIRSWNWQNLHVDYMRGYGRGRN